MLNEKFLDENQISESDTEREIISMIIQNSSPGDVMHYIFQFS